MFHIRTKYVLSSKLIMKCVEFNKSYMYFSIMSEFNCNVIHVREIWMLFEISEDFFSTDKSTAGFRILHRTLDLKCTKSKSYLCSSIA